MNIRNSCWLLLLVVLYQPVSADSGTGLQMTAAVDLAGGFGVVQDSGGPNRLNIFREGEIAIYSPADHLFDGFFSIVAENEGGVVAMVLHEARLSSSKLIPRSRIRVGQFFLGVGRLNRIHRHDWPFISSPRVHDEVFDLQGAEAAFDTGLEYNYLLPLPLFLELTAGITSGWTFGHDHGAGASPQMPTHYARLATFVDLFSGGGTEIGFSYLGRKDNPGNKITLLGLDAIAKWRRAKRLLWMIQTELWYKRDVATGVPASKSHGGYLYVEHGLGSRTAFGIRGDYYKEVAGNTYFWGFVPVLTYRPSEFTTFRASYNAELVFQSGGYQRTNHFAEIQAVFILGSHPAHNY